MEQTENLSRAFAVTLRQCKMSLCVFEPVCSGLVYIRLEMCYQKLLFFGGHDRIHFDILYVCKLFKFTLKFLS